ncbi:hypothetical protein VTL71DRAFT_15071 [Oculimacula yallundae]|uniref:2EXR domain-containing protein n=1 Tax=Oculimacula yallundae TaxID=86028 RepID=A0ABR4CFI4_9HELO
MPTLESLKASIRDVRASAISLFRGLKDFARGPVPNKKTAKLMRELPNELEIPIWEALWEIFAREAPSRTIELVEEEVWSDRHQAHITRFRSPHRLPILLHICAGSREAALRYYEWSFGVEGLDGDAWRDRICINWKKDVVYFRDTALLRLVNEGLQVQVLNENQSREQAHFRVRGIEMVQQIAIRMMDRYSAWPTTMVRLDPVRWTSIREITVVRAPRNVGREPVLTLAEDLPRFKSFWLRFHFFVPRLSWGILGTINGQERITRVYSFGWVERGKPLSFNLGRRVTTTRFNENQELEIRRNNVRGEEFWTMRVR